ncbi:tripartite tricarboxylate transporter TctB family protein [Zobellella denitrificans]
MKEKSIIGRCIFPETIAGIIIISACLYLLTLTENMPRTSSLLPQIILWSGVILSATMITQELRKRLKEQEDKTFFIDKRRFLIAATLCCLYIPSVHFVGFYSSTILFIPITALLFGYRNKTVTIAATTIFITGLFVIFSLIMGKELPSEFFLY